MTIREFLFGEKKVFTPKSRRVNRYDKPLEMGVCVPQDFEYRNEIEQYARYLELTLQFYEYEHVTPDERDSLQGQVDAINEEKADKSGVDAEGMNVVHIPSCMFNCGTAPCCCHSNHREYLEMRERYSGWFLCANRCYDGAGVKRILEELDRHNRPFLTFTKRHPNETP